MNVITGIIIVVAIIIFVAVLGIIIFAAFAGKVFNTATSAVGTVYGDTTGVLKGLLHTGGANTSTVKYETDYTKVTDISNIGKDVADNVNKITNNVTNSVENLANITTNTIENVANTATNNAKDIASNVANNAKDIASKLVTNGEQLANKAFTTGKQLVNNITNGSIHWFNNTNASTNINNNAQSNDNVKTLSQDQYERLKQISASLQKLCNDIDGHNTSTVGGFDYRSENDWPSYVPLTSYD